MTEREWLECTDPTTMLEFLSANMGDRKIRLFAASCCRRVIRWIKDERSLVAVDVGERFADRRVDQERLNAARKDAFAATTEEALPPIGGYRGASQAAAFLAVGLCVSPSNAPLVALEDCSSPEQTGTLGDLVYTATYASRLVGNVVGDGEAVLERLCQLGLLRDVVGNPFRPVSIDPIWLTPTVTALAQTAYDERIMPSGELDPARLAVLSDCLEESGCDDDDILSHLRSEGPHVRGCWAVDLILGKE